MNFWCESTCPSCDQSLHTLCPRSLDPFYVFNKLLYRMGQDFLNIHYYISRPISPLSLSCTSLYSSYELKIGHDCLDMLHNQSYIRHIKGKMSYQALEYNILFFVFSVIGVLGVQEVLPIFTFCYIKWTRLFGHTAGQHSDKFSGIKELKYSYFFWLD